MPDELTPSQAARNIGATTRSVQRWIATGRLPARRVGGRWRVASDALDAFVTPNLAPAPIIMPPQASTTGSCVAATSVAGTSAIGVSAAGRPPGIATLYVANRGEIVRRIGRTARRLGIEMIAPESRREGADGASPDDLDLLDIDAVVAAARAARADALHPGFGFLAENADFAQAVIDAGIRWVGPPPGAIRAIGDKAAARRLATKLGIPIVPGYDGPDQSDATLAKAAGDLGFPVLVKPAAGGGGKGMRTVRDAERFADAVAGARREAAAAFGDDRLILERLIEGPRHVEVQVLFDRSGHGIHLGERDCSLQRRHQKILEETPSPAVTPEVRRLITDAALALASEVGYESAGTCEFLLTDRGEACFLEMNTRLQVEHPVTELVMGLDLVEEQLRIAAGEPLRLDQGVADRARERGGHAIEARVYAEDAESGFLPATGRVEKLRWPNGDGIRIDAGIDEGTVVRDRFDPMLAKIIAQGADRNEALERLTAALDDTLILGLTTNLRFLRWLVREPVVRDGEARTDTLEPIWPPDDWAARTSLPDSVWQAAAGALVEPARDGWRLNEVRRLRLASEDEERTVQLVGNAETVELVRRGDVVHIDAGGRSVAIGFAPPPDVDRAARAATGSHPGARAELISPMPGAVVAVHRADGDHVEAGDPIVTLEAMKMEHVVVAPMRGTLADLSVRAGDQVTRGQALAAVEP
jgi:acetyl-CoA/propionyl-CoA carboxylase biotin carboxyl carrier protein